MKRFSPEEQLDVRRRGTVEIISEEDLLAKLRQDRPLRVKLGVDPSAPDIHLGMAVVLRKLRQFQDLGHQAILVVGDFTGMIGDPSEKKKTRPMLTREEIQRNVATYRDQYGLILDPPKTQVAFNTEWLGHMSFEDVIRLGAKMTVARALARHDFTNRLRSGVPIVMQHLLYPRWQAAHSCQPPPDAPMDDVRTIAIGLEQGSVHPREAKARLAREIVAMWHGKAKATQAERAFERVFVEKDVPSDIPEAALGRDELKQGRIRLTKLLVLAGLAESNSEAKRLISQGGVSVDGDRVHKVDADVAVKDGVVLRVGKRRFVKVRLE